MGSIFRNVAAGALAICMLGVAGVAPAEAGVQDSYPVTERSTVNTVITGYTGSAGVQGGEPGECSGNYLTQTVWTRFRGTGGPVLVDTGGSNFDTIAIVYTATGDGSPGTKVGCNDDSRGTLRSSLTVSTQAGTDYLVQVGGCVTQYGRCTDAGGNPTPTSGSLVLTLLGNDQRANAEPIPAGQTLTRTNYWATVDAGEVLTCNGVDYGSTVWFKFSSPAPGTATFVVTAAHSVLAVYKGGSGTPETCASSVADNTSVRTSIPVGTGDYLVQVGGHDSGQSGSIGVIVEYAENRDLDGDKYDKSPGPDCDDGNAAIHPGAHDVPHNGVDEDCAHGDNLDGDADGHAKAPPGDDCNDANHAIHPGAVERLGDFVDENCDGVARPSSISAEVTFPAVAVFGGRRFNPLVVANVRKGYRIRVRCRGSRRCPRPRTITARSRRKVTFKAFRGKVFGARTIVEVFVTVPRRNTIGYYKRYTMRGTRKPRTRICDLRPSRPSRPVRCR